jgi:hypothetical protein
MYFLEEIMSPKAREWWQARKKELGTTEGHDEYLPLPKRFNSIYGLNRKKLDYQVRKYYIESSK